MDLEAEPSEVIRGQGEQQLPVTANATSDAAPSFGASRMFPTRYVVPSAPPAIQFRQGTDCAAAALGS